uniref:E3 ubiquitin-protein ligase rnf213-alpha-like n=1 Tax=Myxine glutinosa TaxID=7769 RepID=UPI00358E1F73
MNLEGAGDGKEDLFVVKKEGEIPESQFSLLGDEETRPLKPPTASQSSMYSPSKVVEDVLDDEVDETAGLSKKKQKQGNWKRINEERIRKDKRKTENMRSLSDCPGTSPALTKRGTDTGNGDQFQKGQNNKTCEGFPTEGKSKDAVFKQEEEQSSLGEMKTGVSLISQTKAERTSENIADTKQGQPKSKKSKTADLSSTAAGLNKTEAKESDDDKTFPSSDKSPTERDKEGGAETENKMKTQVDGSRMVFGPSTKSNNNIQKDKAVSSPSNIPSHKQNSSSSKTHKIEKKERQGRNDVSKKHPDEMPKSMQDIREKQVQPPAKEDVAIVFVAVLAKEFEFNEQRQKVVILQKSAGDWINLATMTVLKRCKDNAFLLEGRTLVRLSELKNDAPFTYTYAVCLNEKDIETWELPDIQKKPEISDLVRRYSETGTVNDGP